MKSVRSPCPFHLVALLFPWIFPWFVLLKPGSLKHQHSRFLEGKYRATARKGSLPSARDDPGATHITSAHIHWPEYISARKPGKWSSLLCCQETRRSTDILLLEREMVEDWSSLNSLELECKLKMLNQLHLGAKVFNGCGKTGQGMTVSRRDISRRAKCYGILVILVSSSWYNGHGRMNNFHRTAKKQSTWRARVSFWKWK